MDLHKLISFNIQDQDFFSISAAELFTGGKYTENFQKYNMTNGFSNMFCLFDVPIKYSLFLHTSFIDLYS